ncbi:MAG: ImmA/IrrE family metallo-endopeptidase [Verrucomicrobia bacterium]|nr:ImmA/IrrE family metallo-endopeptidase [Verrucomicrobiota bacterium]
MNPSESFSRQLGERIRLAREAKGITQDSLAAKLSFQDRQTISTIETGVRQVQPDELTKFCQVLGKPLAFFTDPYIVTETHAFSYRAKRNTKDVAAFERKAHNLISANRRFRAVLDEPAAPIGPQLRDFGKQTSICQATLVGERVSKALALGDSPALKLRETIEAALKVMVLFVDAPMSISGAACHLPDGDFILLNRNEPSFRRHYDLGHEFFHILTWEAMPPEKLDTELDEREKPRVEKLADAFTAGLLMPTEAVSKRWASRPSEQDIHDAILDAAKEFRVSGKAMFWRLVNTSLLTKTEQDSVDRERLSRPDDPDPAGRPNLYNADFVKRLHTVLQRGFLTARKAADLLDCDLDDLRGICAAYGHALPFAL